jgi:hypothetical protein
MLINCQFDLKEGDGYCDYPYIETISYNGEDTYILNYWTNGEIIFCLLFTIFLLIYIIKWFFEFFFPKVLKYKSKY